MKDSKDTVMLVIAKALYLDVNMSNADSIVFTIHVVRRPRWAGPNGPEWLILGAKLCGPAECGPNLRAFMHTTRSHPEVSNSASSRMVVLRIADVDTHTSIIPVYTFTQPTRRFSDEERASCTLDLLGLNGDIGRSPGSVYASTVLNMKRSVSDLGRVGDEVMERLGKVRDVSE